MEKRVPAAAGRAAAAAISEDRPTVRVAGSGIDLSSSTVETRIARSRP